MEFQCFEIQIKTEADSNECPHDDKPSTGMFAVSDDISTVLCQKGLSDISSFLEERQKRDFKPFSFPLLFGK